MSDTYVVKVESVVGNVAKFRLASLIERDFASTRSFAIRLLFDAARRRGESELRDLNKWLERYRAIWEERMEQLDELVQELEASTPNNTDRSVGEGRSTLRQPRERTPAQGPLKNEVKNARRRKK